MDHHQTTTPPSSSGPSPRQVLFAFYLTQFILFLISFPLCWWMGKWQASIFRWDDLAMWGLGIGTGLVITLINLGLNKWFPDELIDDGGINKALFANRSVIHILIIATITGFCEELLFRWVIQEYLGVWLTSILFVLVHTRYLKKWPLVLSVGLISVWFGWMVELTNQLTPAIIAHATSNFISGLILRFTEKSN